jgi:uncharacterized membrane protein
MLDALYRRRLERDLEVWRQRGLVSPDAATQILESVQIDSRPRTANIVGFLGAILIAFAAIAFVAANWAEMPRPLRLGLLIGGMALCYGLAAILDRIRHPWFADAAIFAGAALFGASIMLVAQSYHISGDYPDALLLWGAGAFVAALLGPSRAALVLSIVVLGLWSWYEVFDFGWTVHWPFLPALALIAGVAAAWGWRAGIHLVVLALAGWSAVSLFSLSGSLNWSAAATTCLGIAAGLLLFGTGRFLDSHARWTHAGPFGAVLTTYGMFGFLALLVILQFAVFEAGLPDLVHDRAPLVSAGVLAALSAGLLATVHPANRNLLIDFVAPVAITGGAVGLTVAAAGDYDFAKSLTLQVVLGALALVAGVWAVAHGNRTGSRTLSTFGLIAFAAEVLYLYFVTFGTLLDTALFFLVGGLLLIGLAATLVRLQRRMVAGDAGGAP